MKTGASGIPAAEYGRVASFDSSSNAALPSTPSGTSGDNQMVDVSHDTETQTILSQTPAWPPEPPETDEFMAFSPESGKFLSGPGVIPVQGATPMPMPQEVGHEQDTQTPEFEQMAFDNGQLGTIDQPPSEEQGA
jgi:hypothetical protein